jgi:sugar lactone lactonase YvrE
LPSDGIALSHDAQTVYYCEISRQILWKVPAAALRNWSMSSANVGAEVESIGTKGFSDGMTADSRGRIYYGNQAESAVYAWQPGTPLDSAEVVARNATTMQWPDTFAWDGKGGMIFVSNKLQLFAFGGMKFDGSDGTNFKIWRVDVNANSYLSGNPQPETAQCLPR